MKELGQYDTYINFSTVFFQMLRLASAIVVVLLLLALYMASEVVGVKWTPPDPCDCRPSKEFCFYMRDFLNIYKHILDKHILDKWCLYLCNFCVVSIWLNLYSCQTTSANILEKCIINLIIYEWLIWVLISLHMHMYTFTKKNLKIKKFKKLCNIHFKIVHKQFWNCLHFLNIFEIEIVQVI